MRIALLNGSPKVDHSTSGALLADLKPYLSEKAEVVETGLHKTVISEKALEELKNTDVLVFSFPLYVDGVPAHLLSCLIQLEKTLRKNCDIHVYGIANCGFYEGVQAEFALELLQNWCLKTGITWGGGIGVGGGGGLDKMPAAKNGHGPRAPVDRALRMMADKILQRECRENSYVSVALPRFLYKTGAQMGWRQMIKANGGKTKDLGKRPE